MAKASGRPAPVRSACPAQPPASHRKVATTPRARYMDTYSYERLLYIVSHIASLDRRCHPPQPLGSDIRSMASLAVRQRPYANPHFCPHFVRVRRV
jgi:hypothetical protein